MRIPGRTEPPHLIATAQNLADQVFAKTGLRPRSDARDIAICLGLRVCPRNGGPAEVEGRRGIVFYDWNLSCYDRNHAICLALARYELSQRGERVDEKKVLAIALA